MLYTLPNMLKTFVQKISGDRGLQIPQENCFQYLTAKEKEKISLQYFENHRAHLALVVQTLDSTIHCINHYPADK